MKTIIVVVFVILVMNVNGQDGAKRINEIRNLYQKIIKEKDDFFTLERDVTWETFEYNAEEDRSLKKNITYYYDGKQIKIAIINVSIIGDYSSYKQEQACYYENGSIFFVYIIEENRIRSSLNLEHSIETINVIEKRIYFDMAENCICYLNKEFEGNPNDIDSLRLNTQNIEKSCSDITDIIKELKSLLKEPPVIKQ
jgi:hypothetical protein